MKAKKKKSRYFIIPPSYFKEKGITPIEVNKLSEKIIEPKKDVSTNESIDSKTSESITIEAKKSVSISIEKRSKSTSGLSLKSIQQKKEHQLKNIEVNTVEEDLPKDNFTLESLLEYWKKYTKKIEDKGYYNLASILSIDTPKLKEHTIYLEFPNQTNKVELERQQLELLSYLRKQLNNYSISLNITVNETLEKQYAYTPEEKYLKLKEKNNAIETLRKTFDLDI